MISLKDVTLLAISSIRIPGTIQSLELCFKDIEFESVKLISHEKPKFLPEYIQFEECPKLNNIDDFNYYMFLEMGKHVSTSHCLIVQDHAYILNPEKWNNAWLNYDYIGSPWRIVENSYIANDYTRSRVGNGGFSMRSKKLLDLPKKMGWELREEQGWKNEDGNICCYYKKEMLQNGIKYAPLELAVQFGFENVTEENKYIKPFGFHRNLPPWDYIA